jgi:8-oxo-dGTP pyrophosphatase MutT (NUDIX family)
MIINWKNRIEEALSGNLPGEISHRKMLPTGRKYSYPEDLLEMTNSGILLLLFPEGDELFTCLIKRPSSMKYHAGQIAFPGGKMEEADTTPLETAVRECHEEIGTDPGKVQILGALTPLCIPVSRFMIFPYVGWSDRKPDFSVSTHEVEKLLFFPLLKHLDASERKDAEVITAYGRVMVPSHTLQGEIIWGASAMILAELLDLLEEIFPTELKQ